MVSTLPLAFSSWWCSPESLQPWKETDNVSGYSILEMQESVTQIPSSILNCQFPMSPKINTLGCALTVSAVSACACRSPGIQKHLQILTLWQRRSLWSEYWKQWSHLAAWCFWTWNTICQLSKAWGGIQRGVRVLSDGHGLDCDQRG